MLTKEQICEIIKTLKGDKTNKDICQAQNLSEAQFGKWLKGEASIKLEDFSKICDAVGVSLSDALKNDVNGELPPKIKSMLMAIREEVLSIWKEVEGSKEDSYIMKIFLDHIRNLKGTLLYITQNNELPKEFIKEHKLEVAENHPEYGEPIKNDDAFQFQKETSLDELALVSDNTVSIRKYSRACAGNAGFMEEVPEYLPYYVEGHKGDSDISLVEVTGNSMLPMIQDGDTLVIKQLNEHPRIASEDHVPLAAFRQKIPHGAICLLNLDDNGAEVKQVFYSGTNERWGLIIKAANPEWGQRVLRKGQTLVIYGIVLGKALL